MLLSKDLPNFNLRLLFKGRHFDIVDKLILELCVFFSQNKIPVEFPAKIFFTKKGPGIEKKKIANKHRWNEESPFYIYVSQINDSVSFLHLQTRNLKLFYGRLVVVFSLSFLASMWHGYKDNCTLLRALSWSLLSNLPATLCNFPWITSRRFHASFEFLKFLDIKFNNASGNSFLSFFYYYHILSFYSWFDCSVYQKWITQLLMMGPGRFSAATLNLLAHG